MSKRNFPVPERVNRALDMAVGTTPANNEQLSGSRTVNCQQRKVFCNPLHLLSPFTNHGLVIDRVGRKHSVMILLKASATMFDSSLPRYCPAADQRFRVALERLEAFA